MFDRALNMPLHYIIILSGIKFGNFQGLFYQRNNSDHKTFHLPVKTFDAMGDQLYMKNSFII